MSRPVSYTEEFARYILEQMREGRTLVDICDHQTADAPAGLPRSGTCRGWVSDEGLKFEGQLFRSVYNNARETMADAMFEQLQTIGDQPLLGERTEVRTELGVDGDATTIRKVQTLDNTERTKIKVDVRKFIASRIRPTIYGERLAHQMLDENGNPAKAGITVIVDGAPGTI